MLTKLGAELQMDHLTKQKTLLFNELSESLEVDLQFFCEGIDLNNIDDVESQIKEEII